MRVQLRDADVSMTHHPRQQEEVGVLLQEVAGERVPKPVCPTLETSGVTSTVELSRRPEREAVTGSRRCDSRVFQSSMLSIGPIRLMLAAGGPVKTQSVRLRNDGRDLERAVELIESLILRAHGTPPQKVTIEAQKRVRTAGVPDEIDLFVQVQVAPGYESIVLFECKDWKKPVGKKDVDGFKAKMTRLRASAGYLVARRFTAGAKALARNSPKVELCALRDVDARSILSASVCSVWTTAPPFLVQFRPSLTTPVAESSNVRMNGKYVTIDEVIQEFAWKAAEHVDLPSFSARSET
jgi:Restriction endonuclease